jgi:hypothetical protein
VTVGGGKVSRVEPVPAGADPTGSEGSVGRRDRCGAAWGSSRMFPSIQRDVDLICLHCQAFIARIAAAKSSTHIP